MAKKPVSVLIADDDADKCYVLSEFFKRSEDIYVCDIAHNGYRALKVIYEKQPDIVLLDIMMPNLDGMGVLYKLNSNKPKKMPKIIMISSLYQDFVLNETLNLGACYYVLKPFNLNSLYEMIMLISEGTEECVPSIRKNENGSENIRRKLISIGVPTSVIGYKYIIESIEIILKESCAGGLLKNIYSKLAKNNSTTPQCVESAIRNAIKKASNKPNEKYTYLFSDLIEQSKHPSNLKFLTRVTESLRIEH